LKRLWLKQRDPAAYTSPYSAALLPALALTLQSPLLYPDTRGQ
jgi:hypothetical protein